MSGKFSSFEKNLIDELITSLKNDLKSKKISFEYEVVDHGRFLGEKFECPRGNAASEKWADRVLSDTFEVTDVMFIRVMKNGEKIGKIDFGKYLSKKLLSENISTINITHTFNDFIHNDEFYPGIGVKIESQRNYEKLRNFFNLKKQNLLDGIN